MKKHGVPRMIVRYGSIISILPSCMLIGYFFGNWADKHWGTEPKLSLIGILVGSAAAILQVFRILQKP